MSQLLAAVVTVLETWLVLFALFLGVGLLVRRAVARGPKSADDVLFCFWLGYAFTIFFLQIWHLAWPVDWKPGLLLALLAAVGLVTGARDLAAILRGPARFLWIPAGLTAAAAVLLASRAIGPSLVSDTGLYHLTSIRWIAEFPVVPGLGNLYGRLAFNQSHFLYAALLEGTLWYGRSFHFANGILVLVLVAHVFASGRAVVMAGRQWQVRDLFLALFTLPVLLMTTSGYASSASPDIAVYGLGVLICSKLLELAESKPRSTQELHFSLACVAILSALGLTVKLSFAVTGAVGTCVALYLCLRRVSEPRRGPHKALALTAISWLAFVVPWVARGVILSGYPAYPSPRGAFDVPWRVPREEAVRVLGITRGAARGPVDRWQEALEGWSWLAPWMRNMVRTRRTLVHCVAPLTAAVSACVFTLLSGVMRRTWYRVSWRKWLALAPWLAGIVFWFFTAPDPRYAGSAFWILAAGAASLVLDRFREGPPAEPSRRAALALLCVSAVLALTHFALHFRHNPVLPPPGPDRGFYPAPAANVTQCVTEWGLRLNVPKEGTLCWDAPLPCTPRPNPYLRLRTQDDLSSGFVVDRGDRRAGP